MHTDILKTIHETKAVSIWDHRAGPVFWYAAGVPGPFYVNTELVIGPALAASLLKQITAIIADEPDSATRAHRLNDLILAAYAQNAQYKNIVAALVAKAKEAFPARAYTLVSGGERRDWLFSIPFAQQMGLPHAFLFKNGALWCERATEPQEKTLHVADLINNAASYFDLWLPILEKTSLHCVGTACVNTRGTNGLERLEAIGLKVAAINHVDLSFFEKSRDSGLIDAETCKEIELYFKSAKEWGRAYLTRDVSLFSPASLDKKSFQRLVDFFTRDPWEIKTEKPEFYAAMQAEIARVGAK